MNCYYKPVAGVLDNLCSLSLQLNGLTEKIEALTGLPWHQLMALKLIASSAPVKVADITKEMLLCPASTEALLDSLETRGLVLRVQNRDDRLAVHVALTLKGEDTSTCASMLMEKVMYNGLKAFLAEGLAELSSGLQWMMSALSAQGTMDQMYHSGRANSAVTAR